MKNKAGRKAVGLLLACCLLLSGCGNTKIVVTTGLASDELFRIGDASCSLSEALVYLMNQKGSYEKVYGLGMWEHSLGGMTMEEYLKNQVVSELAQVKSMTLLAQEQEIVLTEEETARCEEASAEYFAALSTDETELLKVDQETIRDMYEDYCLAFKAYRQITEEVSVEISDDEARIIELQQMFLPEEGLAEELKERLENGEDFGTLASNYSRLSQTTLFIARGDKGGEYEEIAFDLDNEEISDVFGADGGYYILKCLNTYVEEESEANKLQVAQRQKTERFQGIYTELMKDTLSEFQDRLWERVSFADYGDVETSSFFEIYQKYFEE